MKYLRNIEKIWLIFTIIALFFLFFSLAGFSSTLRMGFPAPSFSLNAIEEDTFVLEEYKGKQKLLILYFYSPDNQNSLTGIKELVKYFEDHITQEKYEIFIINTQKNLQEEDLALMKKYLSDHKIPFPLLLDSQNMVSKLYNIEILPTAIFLDTNLIVKRVYPGFILRQQNLMFQYINYLLDCQEIGSPTKEKNGDKGCNGDPCPPPPGY